MTKSNCTAALESSLAVLHLVTYEPTIPFLDINLRKLNTCGHTKIMEDEQGRAPRARADI